RILTAEVGRGDEELKALGIPSGRAVPLVHVSACNPLSAGRDSHLIASPIVSDHCSHGMGAMGDEIVIAGEGRVWAAGSATAVNGVVPIVVVVGNGSVPAAIMPNEGRMVPLDPRVPAGQHHALSCKSLSPDIRSMDLKHVPLDGIDLILWRASRARRCKR